MKDHFLLCIAFITAASPLFAYEEWSLPNLSAPTVISPVATEVFYQHQFTGNIIGKDRPSNLFGIGEGADAYFGIRSVLWRKAQAYVAYNSKQLFTQSHNEFTAGIAYAYFIPRAYIRLQGEGEIYSFASYLDYPEKRKTGYFIRGCLQSDPLFNHLTLLGNIGYGFNGKPPGLGLGVTAAVTGNVAVYGTYFPVVTAADASTRQSDLHNPFAFGIKVTTYGHQFFLFAGNATETGSRHLMQGTGDNNVRFGFMIKRLFAM